MISLVSVPTGHEYKPNNVCSGCMDVFQEKEAGAPVLCHEGLKDKQVLQCFMDKNCAEEWARARIENVGLNQDGSLDCYNCRSHIDPASILPRAEVDRLQGAYIMADFMGALNRGEEEIAAVAQLGFIKIAVTLLNHVLEPKPEDHRIIGLMANRGLDLVKQNVRTLLNHLNGVIA